MLKIRIFLQEKTNKLTCPKSKGGWIMDIQYNYYCDVPFKTKQLKDPCLYFVFL